MKISTSFNRSAIVEMSAAYPSMHLFVVMTRYVQRVTLLALLIALSSGVALSATSDRRVALVIGNGAYRHAGKLANPTNDARAIRAALQRLGFEVIGSDDLDRGSIEQELRAFRRAAYGASVAVVFYAGHALQVAGQNYILPVSANIEFEQDLAYEAIAAETLLNETSGAALRIVILDACRDNPFKAKLSAAMGARSAAVGRGLRPIEAPSATVIAYATRADDVAADGAGENSPFTTALLKHIETPGLEVRFLFGRVSDDVRRATGGKQDPAIYASLGGTQYFLSTKSLPPTPGVQAVDAEMAFWDAIKTSSNPADYRAYLETYPTGRFAALARVRSAPVAPSAAPPAPNTAPSPAETPTGPPPPLPQSKPAAPPPPPAPPPPQAARAEPAVEQKTLERSSPTQADKRNTEGARDSLAMLAPPPIKESPPRNCPAKGTVIETSLGRSLTFENSAWPICRFRDKQGKSNEYYTWFLAASHDARKSGADRFVELWPLGPEKIGKTISFTNTVTDKNYGTTNAFKWDLRVLRQEKLQIAAGVFDTFVVEVSVEGRFNNNYRGIHRYWVAPSIGWTIKYQYEFHSGRPRNDRNWEATRVVTP